MNTKLNFYNGGPYDVGSKVPEAILHKPSELSEEERTSIRLHTEYGYQMLKDLTVQLFNLPQLWLISTTNVGTAVVTRWDWKVNKLPWRRA